MGKKHICIKLSKKIRSTTAQIDGTICYFDDIFKTFAILLKLFHHFNIFLCAFELWHSIFTEVGLFIFIVLGQGHFHGSIEAVLNFTVQLLKDHGHPAVDSGQLSNERVHTSSLLRVLGHHQLIGVRVHDGQPHHRLQLLIDVTILVIMQVRFLKLTKFISQIFSFYRLHCRRRVLLILDVIVFLYKFHQVDAHKNIGFFDQGSELFSIHYTVTPDYGIAGTPKAVREDDSPDYYNSEDEHD
jgi:hypothetical protein